jgi:hypothetical protein
VAERDGEQVARLRHCKTRRVFVAVRPSTDSPTFYVAGYSAGRGVFE